MSKLTVFVLLGLALGDLALAQTPQLFLNGQLLSLKSPILFEKDQALVPLVEVARFLGADATVTDEGAVLRWGLGQSAVLTAQDLIARGPAFYISLSQLVQTLGVRSFKLGSGYYLFRPPARLHSVRASSSGVFFTFSARVPFELQTKDQLITLRFFNAIAGEVSDHTVKFSKEEPGILKARISLDRPPRTQATTVESEKSFIIWVRFTNAQQGVLLRTESQTRLNDHALYVQARALTLDGPVSLRYLLVHNWKQAYRLTVTLPPDGIGSLAPLDEMARGAFAAINANFFDPQTQLPIGLLMKDGIIHSSPYGRRGALMVTLFNSLEFAAPVLKMSATVLGQTVEIDGINRPPHANGLFLYTARYALPIRNDSPLRAVRLQHGVVVSVTENGLVLPDGESVLLIATGSARSRLGGLRLGDTIKLSQALEPAPLFLREAISAGPILIKEGQIVLDSNAEGFSEEFSRAPAARSVVALTESEDLLFIVILKDGRSVGADLRTLATLVKALGAHYALALDGGSSSMLLFRQGAQFQSVGGRRPIAAGLALVPKR